MRTLVRFTRTTYDDNEVAQKNFGDTSGNSHFKQLEAELRAQGFALPMEMVKFEGDGNSALTHPGTLLLYVMVGDAPHKVGLVEQLQHCYDEGASGFFETIAEGLN